MLHTCPHLFSIKSNFVCSASGGLYPLVSNEAGKNVPKHVYSRLWTETHFTGHPAMGYQHLNVDAHLVEFRSLQEAIKKKGIKPVFKNVNRCF